MMTLKSTFACVLGLAVGASAIAAVADAPNPPPKGAPEYEAPPRPTDGTHMALTIEKLEKGLDPDRPLLIWAIGSSFTNGLGNGDYLVELIRQRFPHAPKIVYKKMAGCSTSYHFLLGWARHLVIPDQPDVVLIYNFGQTEDLEKVIVELRRHTTADLIVPTLHWCVPHKQVWGQPDVRNSHQDPPALRAMAATYGVEFVENRLEMTQYMVDHKLGLEDLLADSVHENRYASKMTVMNIARHFHRASKAAYDPRSRERRVEAESAAVAATGAWEAGEEGAARVSREANASVSVEFTGNRIDLVGWRGPEGGSVDVWIDGKPADQAAVFYPSYVDPDGRNAVQPPMPPRDRSPHGVSLGGNLTPQKWTITMASDRGDFELVGSVTGADGKGNAFKPFTSNSGQIAIDPALWREAKSNRTGDAFRFEVYRPATGRVEFRAAQKERFRLLLVGNLPNGRHTLKLVARGDGPVAIDAFDVFEPPLK